MESYNFWQDLFDTYQSLSDWMKFAWLVVPPVFVLSLTAMVMRFRVDGKQASTPQIGELVYTIYRDGDDRFHVVCHGQQIDEQPTLLFLDPPSCDLHASRAPDRDT